MGPSRRRTIGVLAAEAYAVVVLAACGGANPTPTDSGAPISPPASTGAPSSPAVATPAAGTKVTAIEKEYSITLSTTTFAPGVYTFEVENGGTLLHNLTIEGPGIDKRASATLDPGGSVEIRVNLQKGTYELSCSVSGHKDRGMDLMIQVV
jgi:uncharacterized cupredoxin-like copper-binding protein